MGAMKVSNIQPTPNPNAFKFLVDRPLAKSESLAYAKPEQARNDVLAQGMFAIPGVETLFFCDNFVTVSMTAVADWRAVAEQVTRLLKKTTSAPTRPPPRLACRLAAGAAAEGRRPRAVGAHRRPARRSGAAGPSPAMAVVCR